MNINWAGKIGIGLGCALGGAFIGVIGSKALKEGAEGAIEAITNAAKAAAENTDKLAEGAEKVTEVVSEVKA